MSKTRILGAVLFLCSLCVFGASPCAAATEAAATGRQLRAWELDQLVEPIALYPDVLLKAILPASTFPDQIVDASLLIKSASDARLIKQQAWDESVKVVATYPGVLKMMLEELPWTTNLGKAFLSQHQDLLDAIQRMRAKAKDAGNLQSNEHQKVTSETTPSGETVIIVQPTTPEVVYVPQTTVGVYEDHDHADSALVPLATFGIGMALGAAMADDDHHYYSGGYRGGNVYWHGDDDFDNWADHRNERWEDYNDRRSDQQDYRQDRNEDQREYRQDRIEDGKRPAQGEQATQRREQAASNMESRQANRSTQPRSNASAFDSSSTSRSWGSSSAWSGSGNTQARSSYSGSGRSAGSSGAFQGYSSGSRTSAMSSRGAASRGRSGGGGGRRR